MSSSLFCVFALLCSSMLLSVSGDEYPDVDGPWEMYAWASSYETTWTYISGGNVALTTESATGVDFFKKRTSSSAVSGIVFCRNKGGNVAPGIKPVVTQLSLESQNIEELKNGKQRSISKFVGNNLQQYVSACPNKKWVVIDFVPTSVTSTLTTLDDSFQILKSTSFQCILPNPETLLWDSRTNSVERRQFNCTKLPQSQK